MRTFLLLLLLLLLLLSIGILRAQEIIPDSNYDIGTTKTKFDRVFDPRTGKEVILSKKPEPIKDADKVKIQTITIQILRIKNTFRILQEEYKKLQAQRMQWNKDILVKYDSKDYVLDAELNWVKKEKPNAITSVNPSP